MWRTPLRECPDAAAAAAPTASAPTPTSDSENHSSASETIQGVLFGESVSSYVTLSAEGVVTHVGVVVPLAAIARAPASGPFRGELVLDMPAAAKQQTFLSQLRVNWLARGLGPVPYGEPHFDFHLHRGSTQEIDAIACDELPDFPPEILTSRPRLSRQCVEPPHEAVTAQCSPDSDESTTSKIAARLRESQQTCASAGCQSVCMRWLSICCATSVGGKPATFAACSSTARVLHASFRTWMA